MVLFFACGQLNVALSKVHLLNVGLDFERAMLVYA